MITLPAVRPLINLTGNRLVGLPLLVLYLTDGCNSRCQTCDIWRLPRRNMAVSLAERLAAEGRGIGLRQVLFSGGEAMQHPEWPQIAAAFRAAGVKVGLLTNGLLLRKQAEAVRQYVDSLTVSLDGATAATYATIRGVDALDLVLDGVRAVSDVVPTTTRTTVQRLNYREMPAIVDAALAAGARRASFLAVDVGNPEAFGPRSLTPLPDSPALGPDDLPTFAAVLDSLEKTHAAHFAAGRIAESPAKLRRLYAHFAAIHGLADYDGPACNAPHLSVVVEVDGRLRPCYFLPTGGTVADQPLAAALNSPEMVALRAAYRAGQRRECDRCVCPLYRGPKALLRGAL